MAPPPPLSDPLRERWGAELRASTSGLWLLTGPNASGKSRLGRWLLEQVEGAELVSAETEQAFYERELHDDDSDLQELPDPGTSVRELLGGALLSPWATAWGLPALAERGYRQLSSGEARKVRLARLSAGGARLLVLDEPFDGLDVTSRETLWQLVVDVATRLPVVLVSAADAERLAQLPLAGVAHCQRGVVTFLGDREAWLRHVASSSTPLSPPPLQGGREAPLEPTTALVRLRDGCVRYGDQLVFAGLDLELHPGEHLLIEGPNGSGKSSLLAMLTGDHPQAYSNDLELFGRRRGTGETIWDIKKHVGLLSGQLHRDYRVPASALEVIVSGWFDSIGLYERVEPSVLARARSWWDWLELDAAPDTPFRALSQGEQRLVLLARAAVKEPWLLVLDEPTSGLDPHNHERVLFLVASLCSARVTTVLFVSHLPRDREFWLSRISGRVLTLPVGRG